MAWSDRRRMGASSSLGFALTAAGLIVEDTLLLWLGAMGFGYAALVWFLDRAAGGRRTSDPPDGGPYERFGPDIYRRRDEGRDVGGEETEP